MSVNTMYNTVCIRAQTLKQITHYTARHSCTQHAKFMEGVLSSYTLLCPLPHPYIYGTTLAVVLYCMME